MYNVIVLHSHDTGRWISPYGAPVDTPQLARFAEESVRFSRAYCVSPTCSPARGALFTGQYPHQNGLIGLAHFGFSLNDPTEHAAALFERAGYESVLCGIQHETNAPRSLGYSRIMAAQPPAGDLVEKFTYTDRQNALDAAQFLRQRNDSRPLFMTMGFFFPHRPFLPADKPSEAVPCGMADTPEVRSDVADYARSVAYTDQNLGIVLQALREGGYFDNSVILYTTDHGPAFPQMKCTLREGGTGISLLVHTPHAVPHVYGGAVTHLDILPTLCELCGIPVPPAAQGKSLAAALSGDGAPLHEYVFGEVNYHCCYEPQRSVRDGRYALIRRYDAGLSAALPNCDDSPSKTAYMREGLLGQPQSGVELFDTQNDPTEQHNVADDPAYAQVRRRLETALDAWMHETGDPLLDGEVPYPCGATVIPR